MNTPSCNFMLYWYMKEIVVWKTLWSIKVWKYMFMFKVRKVYDINKEEWRSA